jgi:hypothetical protein
VTATIRRRSLELRECDAYPPAMRTRSTAAVGVTSVVVLALIRWSVRSSRALTRAGRA